MQLDSIGQVLGTREFDNDGKKVMVSIGVPREDGPDYFCPYQIIGLGDAKIRYAMGVDALQSLELALKKIGTDLYTSNEAKAGKLSWEGEAVAGDLGFPLPDVLKDLLPAK